MKISRKHLESIRSKAPTFDYKPRPISIHARILNASRAVRDDIERHHSAVLALLEEAIRFIISFENYQYSRDDRKEETTSFKFLLSRVRADLIAIRQLLLNGQESSALAIGRVFIEDIELLMATAIDADFSREYLDTSSEEDFWRRRVGYGRIYPLVERFISRGANDHKDAQHRILHHKQLKSFLSSHIHPTCSAALRTVFPPALDRPGLLANRPLGWFGLNSAKLCLYIADEIQTFAACCVNMFIKSDPPASLAGFKPDKNLAAIMLPAHTLQELVSLYANKLIHDYERRDLAWEEASSGQPDKS